MRRLNAANRRLDRGTWPDDRRWRVEDVFLGPGERRGNATGFGQLVEAPEAIFEKMNEEHGYVDLKNVSKGFKVGDRVRMIPNHVCVAVNLHEQIYGIRGDRVEETWKVEARGKLQ